MAQRPRQFRTKNLAVSLTPSGKLAQITDKLRICILHTNLCLGWTQCRLLTHYCLGWISWCRFFTCRWGTFNCDRPYSWVACRVGTLSSITLLPAFDHPKACAGPRASRAARDLRLQPASGACIRRRRFECCSGPR
jgi:hypothetical protein